MSILPHPQFWMETATNKNVSLEDGSLCWQNHMKGRKEIRHAPTVTLTSQYLLGELHLFLRFFLVFFFIFPKKKINNKILGLEKRERERHASVFLWQHFQRQEKKSSLAFSLDVWLSAKLSRLNHSQ